MEKTNKPTIIIWVDASYKEGEEVSSWGAVFTCPIESTKIKISGRVSGVKNSTHAEIAGLWAALEKLVNSYDNIWSYKIEARIDCKSVVDLYMNGHKTKNIYIGRVLYKISNYFGDILKITHVHGHSDPSDSSLDSVRNREVHDIAYKKRRVA